MNKSILIFLSLISINLLNAMDKDAAKATGTKTNSTDPKKTDDAAAKKRPSLQAIAASNERRWLDFYSKTHPRPANLPKDLGQDLGQALKVTAIKDSNDGFFYSGEQLTKLGIKFSGDHKFKCGERIIARRPIAPKAKTKIYVIGAILATSGSRSSIIFEAAGTNWLIERNDLIGFFETPASN